MSFGQSKDIVCKYYLQGQCRFGTSCRFAHPAGQGSVNSGTGTFRNQMWSAKDNKTAAFDAESILKDLTHGQDRPLYPLSSYGPGKCVPCVIDELDQSPEELRVAAWTAVTGGTGLNAYQAHEKELIDAAQALVNAALTTGPITLDEAKRVWNAVDERGAPPPNGVVEAKSRLRERLKPSAVKPAFGSATNTPAFGTTSAFGSAQPAQSTAFGGTGFVKPGTGAFGSNTGTGAFGGTSTFGSGAFGSNSQPSAFGTPTQASAFGSNNTTSTPAFGQSAFGSKPSFGQSAFGTTSTPAPSTFGNTGNTTNTTATPAFGQSGFGSSTTGTSSAFGQSSFGTKPPASAFGASGGGGGFGAFANKAPSFGGTNTGNTTSAFGASASGGGSAFGSTTGTSAFGTSGGGTGSGFGAFASQPTPFGAQSGTGSAFGAASNTTGSAFGQPPSTDTTNDSGMDADAPATAAAPSSAFGQTTATTAAPAFGQTQTQPAPSAFGQTGTGSAFGQGSSAFGSSAFGAAKPSAFGAPTPTAVKSAFGTTSSAFSAPSSTSAFGSTPAFGSSSAFGGTAPKSAKDWDPYAALLPPDYATTLSEGIMNAFKADKFELGSIPECVPPFEVR